MLLHVSDLSVFGSNSNCNIKKDKKKKKIHVASCSYFESTEERIWYTEFLLSFYGKNEFLIYFTAN